MFLKAGLGDLPSNPALSWLVRVIPYEFRYNERCHSSRLAGSAPHELALSVLHPSSSYCTILVRTRVHVSLIYA